MANSRGYPRYTWKININKINPWKWNSIIFCLSMRLYYKHKLDPFFFFNSWLTNANTSFNILLSIIIQFLIFKSFFFHRISILTHRLHRLMEIWGHLISHIHHQHFWCPNRPLVVRLAPLVHLLYSVDR